MASANRVKLQVIDQNGKSCDTSFYVPSSVELVTDASLSSVVTAIVALIEGGTTQYDLELIASISLPGGGTAAGYNAADKIHVVAKSVADASTVIIDFPCPGTLDGTGDPVFLANGTLNTAGFGGTQIVNFVNTYVLDTNGSHVTFVSGKRTRSERLRTAF
jgi:hypothetical protein